MRVSTPRRPFSFRLNICLVFYCITLLSFQCCSARVVDDESSVSKIEEVHDGLIQIPLVEPSHINEELKSEDKTDNINDKRHHTDVLGKSHKENEDEKIKDLTANSGSENSRKVHIHDKVERHSKESEEKEIHKASQRSFKRLVKRPIRRSKRNDQVIHEKEHSVSDSLVKSVENKKTEINENLDSGKKVNIDGIRRLDVDVDEEDKKENHGITKLSIRVDASDESVKIEPNVHEKHIHVNDNEQGRSTEVDKSGIHNVEEDGKAHEKLPLAESISHVEMPLQPSPSVSENDSGNENRKILNQLEDLPKLQSLRAQALELQVKIRNNTFLQSLKSQTSEILPDVPKLTEKQILDMLKGIISKKELQESSDFNIESLKSSGLDENQIEIIKCAQQLVAQKERQSFVDNMSECIRGLNVINCMRIFIYPIIIDNIPEVISQRLPNFPIEINVADILQGNRDKTKVARQVPIGGFYMAPTSLDPDALIFDILMEGILKNPPNDNLPSFIDAKNESFSKLLTCNKVQLLRMSEKFLPENVRPNYSDEMLSCVKRFEYFSCMKYFSWPEVRKYYTSLPEFPLSDVFLSSIIYPNYPLITYPGFESGLTELPEVVEAGPPKMAIESYIMNILRKTYNEYARIPTPPTPVQLNLLLKNQPVTQEQIATIHLAEQLLPINLRAEYVLKTVQCISQYDFYNCFKYASWPVLRQFNPQLPPFPSLQEIINNIQTAVQQFQLPQFQWPSNFSLSDFFSQFQLPQFQFPPFQWPPNFIPGQPTTTTTSPPVQETPANDPVSEASKLNNTALESKIYKILKNVRDSMGPTPLSTATYTNRKIFLFPLMTEDQSKIFALAESIVPPLAREPLITSIYFCLNDKNEFTTCAKTVIWPHIRNHVKGLPDFPPENNEFLFQQKLGINVPFMPHTASGDNFYIMREIENLFSEGHEYAMSYIIRSIQSSSEPFNMQKILEILRSIQFNAPDFLKMQLVKYPRVPEYVSLLTESQENIVHAVESMIPEQIRPKFSNDMMDCAQKNKFAVCSKSVIFPAIYPYFQRVLSIPYYTVASEQPNLPKLPDSMKIQPIRLETKVNTEQQGENIIINTDRKFMPIYPSNPEVVILSMLRKIQIGEKSLPELPKESIAYTPEFKEAFSHRQAHILTIAESILPEEFRKGLLEEMFKCNQRDSFLNCTRDIVFPVMAKAYPDFPSFPNIENDLNRSNMLLIIDSLNKAPLASRSYSSKRNLPFTDILYKLLPEDKADVLRMLIDKLPDTLYYDLYVKMSQCAMFSNSIYCGQDIIYPTLKKYYDAPGFNLDNYYPISAQPLIPIQRQPLDYEIICENMGLACTLIPLTQNSYSEGYLTKLGSSEISYIPFGKLSDGSRILKQAQDIWNSNITPSVGIGKINPPEYATQRRSNHINFKSTPGQFFQIPEIMSEQNLQSHRHKRNVDDLLDSYSDSIPDNKKNSVPRRIPPKLTFPNITETELLQILVHIAKHNRERASGNGNVFINEYFVDSLNDTDKALITADQYEILKLVQGLNSETAKAGFMSRVVQCIRSLSFIRCVGIFVWPMIVNNLPSLPFTRDSRSGEEIEIQKLFGVSSTEFETELLNRKEHMESNLIQWYKSLIENKFETNIGPLKIKGHGDGELSIFFSGYREGRLSKIKDNKNLPSILTIISEVIEEVFDTKPNKTKNKKENSRKDKRDRSLRDHKESNVEISIKNSNDRENFKRSVKDDQVINMLLDRLRPSTTDFKEEKDMKHYFHLEDAYTAFQVLFGPKVTEKMANHISSEENIKHFEENFADSKPVDELVSTPFNSQEEGQIKKLKIPSSRSKEIYKFDNSKRSYSDKNLLSTDKFLNLQNYMVEYLQKYLNTNKKKVQTGLIIKLPKLTDDIVGRKITSNFDNIGRSLKTKMKQMMPAAGLAVSFVAQLILAHANAAASVAGLLSNMALGSAMVSMVRDMVFTPNSPPNIKVIYETDKYDAGIPWQHTVTDPTISFTPPSSYYASAPHYH